MLAMVKGRFIGLVAVAMMSLCLSGADGLRVVVNDGASHRAYELTDADDAKAYVEAYAVNVRFDGSFKEHEKVALETVRREEPVFGTWWAVFPPLLAIALALITKEVYSSLFLGIVSGGVLYALKSDGFFGILETAIGQVFQNGFIEKASDSHNVGILVFLVLLGALVAMMNKTGASAAFGRWAQRRVKSRVGAQVSTVILGVMIFVDDYFNCLTVGSVMTPVTDSQRISRVKLAYLIDATAAPICMIAPISSWAAAVSGVAAKLDTGVSGIQLFIEAIPYNFYSLLTIVFVITMVVLGVDYGPMAAAELKAAQAGDLGALSDEHEEGSSRANMWDMLIPIFLLIIFCVIGLIYVGGFWDPETNAGDFIAAFGDTDAFVGLPWGALIALVLSIIYLCARRVITFKGAMGCMTKGFNAMVPAILILTFAVSLKSMTGLLGAADYVEGLMKQASEGLFMLLPAIIFVVACLLAFATGTSWGTFGILIPIVLPIFNAAPDLQIMGISACLAGAVCGDHCSPISDTTIMASAGANCNHIDHVSTQIPYAVTVAAICFVNYILAAFIRNVVISLAIGVVMVIGTLLVIRSVQSRKAA